MRWVDGERDPGERVQLHRGTWGRWPLCEHRRLGLGAASGASTSLVRWVSGRHKGRGGHSCARAADTNNTSSRSRWLRRWWAAGRAAGVPTVGGHPGERRTGSRAGVLGGVRCRGRAVCRES